MVLDVIAAVGAGVVIGLSLAAPPGPVNALIASHAVTRSWRAGFLVGCGAMTADAGFLALSVAANALVLGAASAFPVFALLGAVVLAYFAFGAIRAWNRNPAVPTIGSSRATSYAIGLVTNLTSPYPLLWWLTAGLVLIGQLGPPVLVGFFAGILLWITGFPYALREAQRRFARTYHAVLAFSIVCLAGFAAWLVWTAVDALV
ncbi:MAG: LysE family translocator [Methanobacteriota archaeon]